MVADQYFTARLLEELGVAVQVCERAGTVPDSIKLARALVESLSRAQPERDQARELSELALGAVKEVKVVSGFASSWYVSQCYRAFTSTGKRAHSERLTSINHVLRNWLLFFDVCDLQTASPRHLELPLVKSKLRRNDWLPLIERIGKIEA
ncbi:hypothetical protein QJS10_CPB15g01065 [Acorus calamus]|uniref:Uncharacterized protein n=1 Tax=Acorus calamus TaxID=4465 RepID=A0AAV9DB83_ACOCL|nr:hypothetical protein QJS10_CPB15g01065 [Acorus calamus]